VDRANRLIALGHRSGVKALFFEALHCRWSTAFFRGDIERALAKSLGNSNGLTWDA
jgi:hypothetical protein